MRDFRKVLQKDLVLNFLLLAAGLAFGWLAVSAILTGEINMRGREILISKEPALFWLGTCLYATLSCCATFASLKLGSESLRLLFADRHA